MSKRIVTIRSIGAGTDMASLVNFGRSLRLDGTTAVGGISLIFSAPASGWIYLSMHLGSKVVDWDLSFVLDPFAPRQDAGDEIFRTTFIDWLEDVVAGETSALAVEMEGTVGALIASGSADMVTLAAFATPSGLETAVTTDRFVLVRDVYTALTAYWESDALNSAWSEWSSKPKWSLRSAIVEDYLASSGYRS